MRARDVRPGSTIRVNRTFHDVDGQEISAGRVFTLARLEVAFYTGGHTFHFTDGTVIRLGDGIGESDAILEDADGVYWAMTPEG